MTGCPPELEPGLFDTSTLPPTHRSTMAATVSRSAPTSPDAAKADAAACADRREE
jgi:hypothetical protein